MANFTPQEIEEMLQEFFNVVGKRQYIGARYVPVFGRRGESSITWNNSAPYEPLTIVIYQGNSYTSRTYVPEGIDILDTDFWANTGNYNAQVEQYRQDVLLYNDRISALEDTIPIESFDSENTVKSYIDGINETINNTITEIESDLSELDSVIYTLDDFEGETPEEKLATALNTVTNCTIICGIVDLTEQITPTITAARQITLADGTFNLNVDGWLKPTPDAVPRFSNCTINGNGNRLFVSDANIVGIYFANCLLIDTCFTFEDGYIQSPYFIGCEVRFNLPNKKFMSTRHIYNGTITACRIEGGSGVLLSAIETNSSVFALNNFSVTNTLIEGRLDTVFEISNSLNFVINGCYFETNIKGLVKYTNDGNTRANLILINNFFSTAATAQASAIVFGSNASDTSYVNNNTVIYANTSYPLIDKLVPSGLYGSPARNNVISGSVYPTSDPYAYSLTQSQYTFTPTWDTSDSSWNFSFKIPLSFLVMNLPLFMFFTGSFSGSNSYRGHMTALLTPAISYVDGAVSRIVDATILSSRNTNGNTQTATIAVSVSPTPLADPNAIASVKIIGFTDATTPKVQLLDPTRLITTSSANKVS